MAVEEGLGLYLLWQIIQSAQFCSMIAFDAQNCDREVIVGKRFIFAITVFHIMCFPIKQEIIIRISRIKSSTQKSKHEMSTKDTYKALYADIRRKKYFLIFTVLIFLLAVVLGIIAPNHLPLKMTDDFQRLAQELHNETLLPLIAIFFFQKRLCRICCSVFRSNFFYYSSNNYFIFEW